MYGRRLQELTCPDCPIRRDYAYNHVQSQLQWLPVILDQPTMTPNIKFSKFNTTKYGTVLTI